MSISANSIGSAASAIQELIKALQNQTVSAGQDVPDSGVDSTSAPPPGPPPGPPPAKADDSASSQFASGTLTALLASQTTPPSASDLASKLIGQVDSDGDGSLSLAEIEKTLGQDSSSSASSLSGAFSQLDANGDGVLSADELTQGLQTMFTKHAGHHHHHARAADAATTTAAADTTTTDSAATADSGVAANVLA